MLVKIIFMAPKDFLLWKKILQSHLCHVTCFYSTAQIRDGEWPWMLMPDAKTCHLHWGFKVFSRFIVLVLWKGVVFTGKCRDCAFICLCTEIPWAIKQLVLVFTLLSRLYIHNCSIYGYYRHSCLRGKVINRHKFESPLLNAMFLVLAWNWSLLLPYVDLSFNIYRCCLTLPIQST